jgi:hypothetical protein
MILLRNPTSVYEVADSFALHHLQGEAVPSGLPVNRDREAHPPRVSLEI